VAPSPTPERSSRGPIAVLLAGIAMTVVGWLVFTIGIFVVVGEGEDGSTALQNGAAVVVVLGAIVGSIGPFLITGGALWWAFSARARQPSPGTSMRTGADRIIG
jgi:hypothetical protein